MSCPASADVGQVEWRREIQRQMADMKKKTKEQGEKIAAVKEENKKLKEKMAAVEEENKKLKEKMDKIMNPEVLYRYLGGDDHYYMKLEKLWPLLEKECNGDKKKLEELNAWKQDVIKKANKRFWEDLMVYSLKGAAVGAVVVVISVGKAFGVVATAGAMFLMSYGATKLYRHYKTEKVREQDGPAEKAEKIQNRSGRDKKPVTAEIKCPVGNVDLKLMIAS